jgi:glutathione synthase/RimK-type ligase-like ATP-grasp enzyme
LILLVSHEADEHTTAVRAALEVRGAAAELIDLADFPREGSLAIDYGRRSDAVTLSLAARPPIDLRTCRVIWWRRPQPFGLHDAIARPNHRAFAYNECSEAMTGLWYSTPARWVNDPTRDQVGARKVYQLRVAQHVGLKIPATLITNDPSRAREFIEEFGVQRTIYKAFSATEVDWRETRLVLGDELSLLDTVSYAPVIFQRYVLAQFDVRATVVGDAIFAAAIYSQETSYPIDFRMDMANARISPVSLPAALSQRLLQLMRALGLVYGAIDLRCTPEGDYVFLEVNPAGQWLFVEQQTGQPITAALTSYFIDHDREIAPTNPA